MKAALLYAPGDLRVEEVPRPEPGPGDVLVQVEIALTDGTDLKTYRRGHPLLARSSPAPFGHEFCGLIDGRRVVAANSAPCLVCDGCTRGEQCRELVFLAGAYAEWILVPERIAAVNLHDVPRGLAPDLRIREGIGTLDLTGDSVDTRHSGCHFYGAEMSTQGLCRAAQ